MLGIDLSKLEKDLIPLKTKIIAEKKDRKKLKSRKQILILEKKIKEKLGLESIEAICKALDIDKDYYVNRMYHGIEVQKDIVMRTCLVCNLNLEDSEKLYAELGFALVNDDVKDNMAKMVIQHSYKYNGNRNCNPEKIGEIVAAYMQVFDDKYRK